MTGRLNGSRVVFDAFGSSIHIADVISGETTTLIGNASSNPQHVGIARGPLWSPDGQWILFGGIIPSLSVSGLLVISPDGSAVRELVGDSLRFASQPVWSHYDWDPSGRRVAYSCRIIDVCIIDRDGTNHRHLTVNTSNQTADYGPRWSPDGTKIATRADRSSTYFQIAVIDVSDGSTIATFGEPGTNNSFPTWSPG